MSDKILKLDQAQTLYQDLRGRIDALPTSEDITVTDVQVNGTSVVTDGVANVPLADENNFGAVKVGYGLTKNTSTSALQIRTPNATELKAGTQGWRVITPSVQDQSTFYGLAKAAGDSTQSASSNTVGNYTDNAKQSIQRMLGITDLLSTEETTTATAAHALNSTFMMNGKLHRATAAIAIGDAVEVGTNCEVTNISEAFPHDVQVNGVSVVNNGVANVPIANQNTPGVVLAANAVSYGVKINNVGALDLFPIPSDRVKGGSAYWLAINPQRQHESVFYGLSKVAGVDLANEEVTLGTYPETSKTAIRSLIGAAAASDIPSVPVQDVQVNGTSVLNQGVANVPIANGTLGAVQVGSTAYGISINTTNGLIQTYVAEDNDIKGGTRAHRIIDPATQHKSVFYGLAKAAGADEKDSTLSVGTYTETAKSAIRTMLGAASTNIVAVQDEQPTDTDTKVWLPETQAAGVEVPTYAEFTAGLAGKVSDVQVNGTSVVTSGVANVPLASSSDFGVVKINNTLGININSSTGNLYIDYADTNTIKAGTNTYKPVTPVNQHKAAFYGLAKAAGDTTQAASDNAVGTYTDGAKTAIQSMLGITQTITVIAQTQDNVTVTDQTVYLREDDANGPIYASAAYEGQPVSFAVPSGFHYHISISDTLAHHFNPTTVSGIVTNASIAATITYSDFSSIASAGDIKAALNAGMDLTDLVGEQITCTRNNETLTWDVVDYDSTNKSIMLLLHDAFGSANMVFEPAQALMWCENGLAAGNYKFTVGTTVYYFTLTQAIPAGGQLVASDSGTFSTYASQSATATIETGTVSTTEITGATDLGTAGSGLLNHNSRVRYGSNNYAESALLWWLNSDDVANTQRVPVTKFSRAYSYNVPGFLYNLDSNFIACLDDVEWKCSTNNVYECPQSLGGYTAGTGRAYTITKKIGLASEMEIFGSYGGNADGSSIFDLYNGASADDRKKYRSTSAQTWWLRSPYWSYAHGERGVHSSGGAVYSYAHYSYAVVPACRISADEETES